MKVDSCWRSGYQSRTGRRNYVAARRDGSPVQGWAVMGRQCGPSSRGRQHWIWQSPVTHEYFTTQRRSANHSRAGISIWTGGHLSSKVSTAVACNRDRDCAASDRPPCGVAHEADFSPASLWRAKSLFGLVQTEGYTSPVMPGWRKLAAS